jgi:hypothetical protein
LPRHRVAVAVEVDDDALERQAEALDHGLDDSPVRLVRHHPGHIL